MPNELTEPIWNAENINRKSGSTTFETCGWCEFAGGGSCRYNAHLQTSCSLLPEWKHHVLFWDSPCIWKHQGKADIEQGVERLRGQAEGYRRSAQRSDEWANKLLTLRFCADPIPVLPDNRKADHFNEGDNIRFYLNGVWESASVVYGYRHHDGCVSFASEKFPAGPNGATGCGFATPTVLLESEWQYFHEHPDVFLQWLQRSDREYNGRHLPMEQMYAAFVEACANA